MWDKQLQQNHRHVQRTEERKAGGREGFYKLKVHWSEREWEVWLLIGRAGVVTDSLTGLWPGEKKNISSSRGGCKISKALYMPGPANLLRLLKLNRGASSKWTSL